MLIESLQKLVLILLYGGLVLQSFVVLINPMKVNKKANFCFGIFLLLWSSYWFLDILKICGIMPDMSLTFSVFSAQIFTPIFLFFSVSFFINPNYNIRKRDFLCLIVPIIYFILLIISATHKTIAGIADFMAIFHNLPYIAIVYFKIKKYQNRIENTRSNTENINLEWLATLSILLFATIIITVGYELYNVFIEKLNQHLVMDLLFLGIVYSISYQVLCQKEIYPVDEKERQQLLSIEFSGSEKLEKKRLIPDHEIQDLKQKLTSLMQLEKPYLDNELNLLKLSALISINAHQLSYLLNTGFNENFFQFVNTYRVEHAKELLKNTSHQKFSILGIAFESGFNSKTSFNITFKKMTGETPSEFRKKTSNL